MADPQRTERRRAVSGTPDDALESSSQPEYPVWDELDSILDHSYSSAKLRDGIRRAGSPAVLFGPLVFLILVLIGIFLLAD